MLAESVKTFIKNNPTWETTPQLEKMLPRFDASHDWTGPDGVALLDELAAVQTTPISMALDHEFERTIQQGWRSPDPLALLEQASALYTGHYLPDDLYDDWATELHPPELVVSSRNRGKFAFARVIATGAWLGEKLSFVVNPPPRPNCHPCPPPRRPAIARNAATRMPGSAPDR